jgi:hypothetical protein
MKSGNLRKKCCGYLLIALFDEPVFVVLLEGLGPPRLVNGTLHMARLQKLLGLLFHTKV